MSFRRLTALPPGHIEGGRDADDPTREATRLVSAASHRM